MAPLGSAPLRLGGFVIHGNHAEFLRPCLRSLLAVCDEVVTVDSESSDASQAIVREHGLQSVVVPWQGYGAARAAAMRLLSPCDYVFFLDVDEYCEDATLREISAWKQASPQLPYYTLKRRDWAELPTGRFLFRAESRKRLVRYDHARWRPDMIVHDALPSAKSAAIDGYIEHHFAQSVHGLRAKQTLYSLLTAVRYAGEGKRVSPLPLRRAGHVLRDTLVHGALWRGGWPAVQLAWAVSQTHRDKYRLLARIYAGEFAELLHLYRAQAFAELFQRAALLASTLES